MAFRIPVARSARHLAALGRSAAVTVAVFFVWIALACSSSSHAGPERPKAPYGAPAWTRGAATSLDAATVARSARAAACAAGGR